MRVPVDYYCCDGCGQLLAFEKDSATILHNFGPQTVVDRESAVLGPCPRCEDELWVSEGHPLKPFPHDDCAGPGMPCPLCNPEERRHARQDGNRSPALKTNDEPDSGTIARANGLHRLRERRGVVPHCSQGHNR